jgi:hypothetical protein
MVGLYIIEIFITLISLLFFVAVIYVCFLLLLGDWKFYVAINRLTTEIIS